MKILHSVFRSFFDECENFIHLYLVFDLRIWQLTYVKKKCTIAYKEKGEQKEAVKQGKVVYR